jgi:hypothetical protein
MQDTPLAVGSSLERLEALLHEHGGSLEIRERGFHDAPLEGYTLTVMPYGISCRVVGHGAYTLGPMDAVQWLQRLGRY